MNKFWLGISIGIIIGASSLLLGVMTASANSTQTTLTVVIQDEVSSLSTSTNVFVSVPCNEVNCPQKEVEVGFFRSIANWFSNLWIGQK